MTPEPDPPAGWYDDGNPNQVRYWDGFEWTDHTAPADAPPPTAVEQETRQCPYCTSQISRDALRCAHCSGELKWCSRCKELVGMTSKQKFVGLARGGMKAQYRCMKCAKTLDGPRF